MKYSLEHIKTPKKKTTHTVFRRLEQETVKHRGERSTSHSVSHKGGIQTFSFRSVSLIASRAVKTMKDNERHTVVNTFSVLCYRLSRGNFSLLVFALSPRALTCQTPFMDPWDLIGGASEGKCGGKVCRRNLGVIPMRIF